MISDRLVWLHIPKTAGDATLGMFRCLEVRWERLDEHSDPRKHTTLPELLAEGFDPGRRAVLANLRRLPEVALSYFHHMQRHDPHEPFADGRRFGEARFSDYVQHLLAHPDTHSYDWLLNHYLGPREVDHWLRVDRLPVSFVEVVRKYHDVPQGFSDRIGDLRSNVGTYERDPAVWYGPGEMERLYELSPRWSAAEKQVYGNLLFEVLPR